MEIQTVLSRHSNDNKRGERFFELLERYSNFKEITTPMIHEFIEKIVVHEREEQMVHSSPQKVEIHLNFVGELELLDREPTAEEIAEEERKIKTREKDRLRYLKRKASGYYDKPMKSTA